MMKIHSSGYSPGKRNNNLKNGWKVQKQGAGYGAKVYNPVSYAKYVMGDETQARQPDKVGWRRIKEIIDTNLSGMMKAANDAVNRWLKANNK